MIQSSEVIEIGHIGRPHGKMGEVQIALNNELWDDNANDITFVIINIDSILVPFRVLDWRNKGLDTVIMQLRGIDSEEKASNFTGNSVYMLRRDCENGDSDSELLTWQDLVGYSVTGNDKHPLGIIKSVDETTINTIAELNNGILIPLHEDLIISLDTDKHTLQIDYSL